MRNPAATAPLLALALAGCAAFAGSMPINGFEDVAAEEAAWRQVEPHLVGMPQTAVEGCAGAPLSSAPGAAGQATLAYRAQDLRNYCQVTLAVADGRVVSVAADYRAPEFMWLRDGSNYCGRIFRRCVP